nr:MAG TPA: hypothetical protein [Caudoviricetes sp.]
MKQFCNRSHFFTIWFLYPIHNTCSLISLPTDCFRKFLH